MVGDHVGRCRCHRSNQISFIAHGVTTKEAKWLGSIGVIKRHSKNNLTRHLTPRMTHPLHRGIQQPYPKWIPRLSWGLPKLWV
jgi:hypothetical protein